MPTRVIEANLKELLWKMARTVDWSDKTISEIEDHPDYSAWDEAMQKLPTKTLKVEGFTASDIDVRKIIDEVEDSCLSEKCKTSLLASLKKAK